MPDSFGLPTNEEIAHYKGVIEKTEAVLGVLQSSPFKRESFDEKLEELKEHYDSFKNSHFWSSSTGHSPLYQIPDHLKNIVDRGMTPDILPILQNEIAGAKRNLESMVESQKNNPMKKTLEYFLNKRD